MKIFRFDKEAGRQVMPYGDKWLTIVPVARPEGKVQLGCFYLGPGDGVGYHEAAVPQLFLVVAGEGWVRGTDEPPTPIKAGQAAFWQAGEWHEAGTTTTMTALVLEATTLDPTRFLREANPPDQPPDHQ